MAVGGATFSLSLVNPASVIKMPDKDNLSGSVNVN